MASVLARRPSVWAAGVIIAIAASTLRAQCAPVWGYGGSVPGTNGAVHALVHWDPDGAGPATPVVVVAGEFSVAGSAVANRVASYDPTSGAWSALGAGPNDRIYALAALPNGQLVAGGMFTTAGGVNAHGIASWNGSAWAPLGSGVAYTVGTAVVYALTVLANGDLVAGGRFDSAGGVAANGIARWSAAGGAGWSSFGSGMTPGFSGVCALQTLPNGDLVAAGGFTTAGGIAANNVARWNGSSWSALGAGTNATTVCLARMPNGDLVAGGAFTSAGGVAASRLARWNGSVWSSLGGGVDAPVHSLAVLPSGDLVAGGEFANASGTAAANIAQWNGVSWSSLGAGVGNAVESLAVLPNGELLAAGWFDNTGTGPGRHLARWNGAAWSALGLGTDRVVRTLLSLPSGDLVAGGWFQMIEGVPARRLAIRSGGVWSELGGGVDGLGAIVDCLARLPNGDLVVGGYFSTVGGVPAACIAKWNGTSWSSFGAGMTNPGMLAPRVYGIARLPSGDLVAAGEFSHAGGAYVGHVARWNGTSWTSLGGGLNAMALAMAQLPDGSLVVGGRFTAAGGVPCNSIARWNGASWTPLGSGLTNPNGIWVYAVAAGSNGDVFAGGTFLAAGGMPALHVARWNGTAWSPMGYGLGNYMTDDVAGLFVLPNGHVLAGGFFRGSGPLNINHLARWDGTTWSSFGAMPDHAALAFAVQPNGDVFVGGAFSTIGITVSSCTAQLIATCPASASPTGPGCLGANAPQLTAVSLPWLGSTFRTAATGLPSNALAVSVLGQAAIALPLGQILPQGLPGCTLLAIPELLDVLPVTAGQATPQFAIPSSAPLLGLTLHYQVIPIALDPQGAIIALTATNALVLTLGSF